MISYNVEQRLDNDDDALDYVVGDDDVEVD